MQLFDTQIVKKKKKFIPGNKVYFSFSSEGLGHSSRAMAIAKKLHKEEVIIGSYNYALDRFQKEDFNCVELPQEFKIIGAKGTFDVKKTIIKNHSWALTFNNIINKEIEVISENSASCVIADGRLAPVMAADRLSLPCLVITNQSAFYPFFAKDSALVRVFGKSFDWVMKTWLSSAEEIMIPDFPPPHTVCLYNLSDKFKVKKRTRFVGPLVSFDHDKLDKIQKPGENYVVVMLGGHSYRKPLFDTVIETAKRFPQLNFDVFANFEINEVPKNVRIMGFMSNIASYLNAADFVITQAGHSTAMELLTLGKPSIVIPDYKQIEQENNALRLEEMRTSLKIEYSNFNPEKLSQAIEEISTNPVYKENAENLRNISIDIQGGNKVIEVIKDYSSRLERY